MKKILIVLMAAALLLPSCAALRQSPEEEARIAALVNQRLDARQYRSYVNYMTPRRGPGKSITDPYCVTVDGSKLNSYLPYFGVAYSLPYGGGKGLNFEDTIDDYIDYGWQKGRRMIAFSTDNGEDVIVYTLTIYEGGSADVNVHCRNRDDISYRGSLDPDSYPKD